MNPTLKNILAVVAGIVVGSVVNMSLINISGSIIPPPEGADVTTMEGLKESMHLFQPKHYIFPFLAHALGTLVGAWVAVRIAANYKMKLAFVIGIFFLIGGVMSVFMLPSPTWFAVVDIVGAYIPMAWIGGKIGSRNSN
jgi:uncharacterized membrane protein YqgA involved in biofilm formation